MSTLKADMCFCDNLGWVDRNALVMRDSLPKIGESVYLKPLPTITRELWGAVGIIEKCEEGTQLCFVRFVAPVKSVGAIMTGVWAKSEHLF